MLGSSTTSVAAKGASVPIWYDPDVETDKEAMIVWDIEIVDLFELSSKQANNLSSHWEDHSSKQANILSSHWEDHEAAMEREEEKRRFAIAMAPSITAPSAEVQARHAVQSLRLQSRAAALSALAPVPTGGLSGMTATGMGTVSANDTVGKLVETLALGAGKKSN